ncbi:MAG TPA: LLM class flavin-dependent oxidoreductase [Pseudonocardia sp.]|jgi:alkanesulfonate monooxygenase SsuD/methylene tetrahydromethanopterin reductase-like flavin-dependent oxidoreductase (luciferase family)|uniref:LLM class flavin-dependent oxidoreductase n=1 Tax=Pseudonocardia sp. TaxID=60912 RepID=UPI002B4AEBA9|nr:LLM class flavin-dependent oxidoreductase [Pseudonocardia sp.]HLU58037.1 LLM class flavin-dependent oxidoreductase [Pseudonocardia sp.]
MKVLVLTLIANGPDPVTGRTPTPNARLHRVVENAVLAEELGFDGYAVGERHERPFLSSAPPVVLSHIAARTSRITLFTGVTTLALLDPVRAYEDYATLDQLADGRLELIIGKGNGAAQAQLFAVTTEDQWDRNAEGYELFRRLWREERTTWSGRFRPPLVDAETWPPPRQHPIRVWHGSATSRESVEVAARYGDPLFSANVTNPIEPYAELIAYYRERWAAHGHDPAAALVGAGTAAFHIARTSQQAIEEFRPAYAARLATAERFGLPVVFGTVEDFVERSSALVGSPQQIVDKVLRYHEVFRHEVIHIGLDGDGLTPRQQREQLELFQAEVAPALRAAVPSRPLAGAVPRDPDDARPADEPVGASA